MERTKSRKIDDKTGHTLYHGQADISRESSLERLPRLQRIIGNRAVQRMYESIRLRAVQKDRFAGAGRLLQRCADAAADALYDAKVKELRSHAVYAKLPPAPKKTADGIMTDGKKKSDCAYYADKLKLLLDTPEAKPEDTAKKFQQSTGVETAKEEKRVAQPEDAKKTQLEETASKDPARTWVPVKGKFGGGTYYVDKTNSLNIVVKARVFLKKAGKGTDEDVKGIKKMEDGIEKAASTQGFLVDIDFVDTPDAETFTAEVDPSKWETATNWSGGSPKGFAHELLHMFSFELDRYNYIEAHAANADMRVADRLTWFAKQLSKPDGLDNSASLMGGGEHPLDDDVCKVAGLDVAKCVAEREKARQHKPPETFQQPAPERQKPGRLYRPRTDFNKEMEQSVEQL